MIKKEKKDDRNYRSNGRRGTGIETCHEDSGGEGNRLMVFHRGILYGKEAVVVRSGIGKVNAAICTQILADHFDVDLVINTGIAGSLDAAIDIGDMVISTDAVQHDMDTSIFGDPIGQVPRMDTFAFPADAQLVEKAVRANQEPIRISIHLPDGSPVETSLFPHRK